MLHRFASVCKRVLGSVNVFKKKSCGASPDTAKFINDVNDSTLKMIRGY